MKRTIEISSRGTRLLLQDARVHVCLEKETLAKIPVEDLGMIILGTTGVSISSGVLKAVGEAGGAILACDDTHHPCGLFLPLVANSLHSERARFQAAASSPLKKNLWARLVRAKIQNQAHVLPDSDVKWKLISLAEKVRSGDEGNREAIAARIYWGYVFSSFTETVAQPFHRYREGPPPNSLLNYGYSVLRATTARALCIAGLNPALGIHHRNRYSGFCLADDLMEPFRPYVDQAVLQLVKSGGFEINKDSKLTLIGAMMAQVKIKGESVSLSHALERSASSLAKAFEQQVKEKETAPKAANNFILPKKSGSCL